MRYICRIALSVLSKRYTKGFQVWILWLFLPFLSLFLLFLPSFFPSPFLLSIFSSFLPPFYFHFFPFFKDLCVFFLQLISNPSFTFLFSFLLYSSFILSVLSFLLSNSVSSLLQSFALRFFLYFFPSTFYLPPFPLSFIPSPLSFLIHFLCFHLLLLLPSLVFL